MTICIFIVTQLFHFVQQRRIDYAQQMENVAHTVRQPLSRAVLKGDIPQAEFILNSLRPAGILARAEVLLPGGLQALRTDFENDRPVPEFIVRLFELPVKITVPLYSTEPANPKPLALLVLQADSWRVYQFILSAVSTMVTAYLLLALILSVSISWSVNRLVVRPLRKIAQELQQQSPSELCCHRLTLPRGHRNDEIGLLVRNYNRNQQRLSEWYHQGPHAECRQSPEPAARLAHDFSLWLQPQVDMRSGQLVGAQMLVGVRQGSHELPPPESGETPVEAISWLLEQAGALLTEWQAREITWPLSISLSAPQLNNPDLIGRLQQQLNRPFNPARLIVSVTDPGQVDDLNALLQPLQQSGVTLALDNIGTAAINLVWLGQSGSISLSQLTIAPQVVALLPDDSAVARMITGLAGVTRLKVVAAGVETRAQRDWLLSQGVYLAQGKYWSVALPLSRFRERYFF